MQLPQSPYIDVARLIPGDVFLTDSGGPLGALNKWATRGPFTHAALYLGAYRYFEATMDKGSHVGRLELVKCEGLTRRLAARPPNWKRVQVFRHQQLWDKTPPSDLKMGLYRAMLEERGYEYPPLRQLADVVTRTGSHRAVPEFVLGWAERHFQEPRQISGCFCSTAVVEILTRAGLKPIQDIEVEKVSPNTLANEEVSFLREVRECVVHADDGIPNNEPLCMQIKSLQTDSEIADENTSLRKQRIELKELEDAAAKVRSLNERLTALMESERSR